MAPTNPQNIPFAQPGQRQLAADDYNGLVQSARSVESIRRGVSNRADIFGSKESTSRQQTIKIVAEEAIPAWSVFCVQDGPYGWSLSEPTAASKKFTGTECTFLTNGQDQMFASAGAYVELCDMYRPHILRYTGTPPTIGNRLGVDPNTYTLSAQPERKQFTVVSSPDTTNSLVWAVRSVCPDEFDPLAIAIDVFEFIEVLKPGYTARARICIWDPTALPEPHYIINPNDTKEYLLFDPEEQNFFLEEERCHALKRLLLDDQANVHCDYVILGAHGLRRKVRTLADIDCGEMGQAEVQRSEPATIVHPPPTQQDQTHCVLQSAGVNLDACNYNGYNRLIRTDELMDMDWDHNRQVWHLNQEDRPIIYEGILTNKMCGLQNSTGNAVSSVKMKDWVREPDACSPDPVPEIPTVDNPLGLWAKEQDKVFFTRDENTNKYHIFQVTHKEQWVITDIEVAEGTCSSAAAKKRKFGMQYCDEAEETIPLFSSFAVSVLTDLSPGACGIGVVQREVCVLGVGPETSGTGITGVPVDMVTGIRVDGGLGTDRCRIELTRESVCVLSNLGPATTNAFLEMTTVDVAVGIAEGSNPGGSETDCVLLEMGRIPIIDGVCTFGSPQDQVIFCVQDCEETPTTVVPEADGDGTYNVGNRQTIPYDSSTATPGGIIIVFPDSASAADGDIVHVANNSMSDIPVTLDGNGNNVQAITAPYNAASLQVGGPKLSINYQLRDGVWRIF